VAGGFRRAEINKLIEVIEHTAFAHDVERNDAAAHGADGKPIGASVAEHVVGRLAPAAAVHIFEHQCGISRDMFAQKRHERFYAEIAGSCGRGADDHGDGLALVKRRLGICATRQKSSSDNAYCEKKPNRWLMLVRSFHHRTP